MRDKSSNTFKYAALNKSSEQADAYTFYLSDGTKIGITTPEESEYGIFVHVFADINGEAKPNIMGRDVFHFIYWVLHTTITSSSGKYIPYDGDWDRDDIINGTQSYCCRRDKTGDLCAALIMKDGWQIKAGYPW